MQPDQSLPGILVVGLHALQQEAGCGADGSVDGAEETGQGKGPSPTGLAVALMKRGVGQGRFRNPRQERTPGRRPLRGATQGPASSVQESEDSSWRFFGKQ